MFIEKQLDFFLKCTLKDWKVFKDFQIDLQLKID